MKHFTFRLFLVRKLIESLTWSYIDEHTEFEDVADGLGRTLSALDGRRKQKSVVKPIKPETIAGVRLLAKTGCCGDCDCDDCPFDGGRHPVTKEQASAWLAEHGIKE